MGREIVPITIAAGQVQIAHSSGSLSTQFMRTVVGSGVSICLWHPQKKCGVMSNFLYPKKGVSDSTTTMFGDISTQKAITLLEKQGIECKDMVAHIVGGSRSSDIWDKSGFENISTARKILQSHRIPIYSEDVSGKMGRKIVFNVENGHIAVVKVYQLRDSDWTEKGSTK